MNTCDQCGPAVTAKYIASLPSGGVLTYCGHCTTVQRPKLEESGALILPLQGDPEPDEDWDE